MTDVKDVTTENAACTFCKLNKDGEFAGGEFLIADSFIRAKFDDDPIDCDIRVWVGRKDRLFILISDQTSYEGRDEEIYAGAALINYCPVCGRKLNK